MHNMSRVYRPQLGICRAPLLARATLMKTTVSDQSSAEMPLYVQMLRNLRPCVERFSVTVAIMRRNQADLTRKRGKYKRSENSCQGHSTGKYTNMAANIEAKICVTIDIYSKCVICQEFIDLNEAFAVPPVGKCCTLIVCVYTLRHQVNTRLAPLAGGTYLQMRPRVCEFVDPTRERRGSVKCVRAATETTVNTGHRRHDRSQTTHSRTCQQTSTRRYMQRQKLDQNVVYARTLQILRNPLQCHPVDIL